MTTERNDFRLCFITDRNEVLTLNIPHADAAATPGEVSDAMMAIIASDAVQSVRGRPRFRYNAALVVTEARDFNILV